MRKISAKPVLTSLLLAGMICAGATAAAAADPSLQPLGEHGKWKTFTYMQDGGKVCFMTSSPEKEQGDYKLRDPVSAFITHWAADGTTNVVSFEAGYTFKTGSTVNVNIDGKNFTLVTHKDTAWAEDQATDNALTDAIKNGSRMVVKGTSSRGTLTTDTYSLRGTTDAHKEISRHCGVK